MSRFASFALFAAVMSAGGCRKDPLYCADQPGNTCKTDAMPDAGCSSSAECPSATPACDLGSMTCVQCLAPDQLSACSGATPACGSDDTCRGCLAHDECGSSACLPDGSCADESTVAYVDPAGTDNAMCTKAMPCTKVASALATSRPYVKLHGTTNEQVTINNQNVTVLADPGAKLSETSAGVILKVDGTSQVAIYDLQIADALGATGIGISMPAGNTAMLTLRRVLVRGNAGGGLSISGGEFDIENSMIVQNGGPTSLSGGIDLASVPAAGTHRIDFDTIAGNAGASTVNSGINCGTVGAPVNFSNNVIYGNSVSGGGKQLGGSTNCTTTYSDIGPDTSTGTGNVNADPMFVDAAQGNFHIGASSPCKDAADPGATLSDDFDRDSRPQGAARDIGADEYK